MSSSQNERTVAARGFRGAQKRARENMGGGEREVGSKFGTLEQRTF